MTPIEAKRYMACARGNAFVAAWLSVLDLNKLQVGTDVPPEEWYGAFEGLYLADVVDPDVFNACDVKKVFFSGNKIAPRDLDDAFWNLRYIRSIHPGEAVDNEEFLMNKRHDEVAPPALDDVIDGPSHPHALARVLGEERALGEARSFGTRELSGPQSAPLELGGPAVERLPAVAPPSVLDRHRADDPAQLQPNNDIRGLPCTDTAPKFSRPYSECANFDVQCCGESVILEDTGGGELFEGGEEDDADIVEFSLHGDCHRCHTRFHMGASMPVPKGSIGTIY